MEPDQRLRRVARRRRPVFVPFREAATRAEATPKLRLPRGSYPDKCFSDQARDRVGNSQQRIHCCRFLTIAESIAIRISSSDWAPVRSLLPIMKLGVALAPARSARS